MPRRKQESAKDYLVAIELLHTVQALLQDPLISSLYAWYWIERMSGLGFDDRVALRLGVIDINGARANVDNSIVLQALDKFKSLAGDLALGLGISGAGGAPAGLLAAGASEAIKKRPSKQPADTLGEMTVQEALERGLLQVK